MDKGACILERSLVAGAQGTGRVQIGGDEATAFPPVRWCHGLKRLDTGREDSRDLQGENQLYLVTEGMRESRVEDVSRLLAAWLMLFTAFTFQVLAC